MISKKQKKQGKQTEAQDNEGRQLTFQKKEMNFNQYSVCRPYPNQTKCITLVSSVAIKTFYFFFVVLTYLLLAQAGITQQIDIISYLQIQMKTWVEAIFVLSLGIKATILTAIILDHKYQQKNGLDVLLMRFIELLRSYLRILIQFDFQTSSLSLITESSLMLVNFTVSLAIISFSLIFLQNYSIRRDSFYIGSINFYFLLRFNIMFGSIVNYFCLILNSSISLYCFLILHTFLAFAQTISFVFGGSTLYRAPVLRWGNFVYVIVYASLIANMWMFFSIKRDLFKFCIYTVLTVLVFAIQFYTRIENQRLKTVTEEGKLPLKAFYLLSMLQESNENIETRTFVDGLLIMHTYQDCRNPQCYTNNQALYDGKLKLTLSTQQLHRNRASLLKFYVKCKFQTFLGQNEEDLDLMLSYSQFIYFQFNNVGLCMYWLKRLSQNRDRLGLSTKLKLNSLLRLIREDNIVFYGKNFEIEDLIEAEQISKSITQQTLQILHQKITLWKMVENSEINLSVLRARTKQIMAKIYDSNQQWKIISKHLQKSKQWKFQYLFFALFLKNERVKNKVLQQSTIFEARGKSIDRAQSDLRKMDMFDENSCTLHTFIHNGEIFIKQVSKHFVNITGYSKAEVQSDNLEVLTPKFIAKKHQNLMIKMSLDGRVLAESVKTNKPIYIVHKESYVLPVLKIYKEFVSKTGELEYICFLKKVQEDECVLLCDPHFEIQAVSRKMMNKVTGYRDGEYIKKMNLISFIPQLTSISCFKQFNGVANTELVSSVKIISKEYQRMQTNQQIQTLAQIQDKPSSQPLNFKSSAILDFVYPSQQLADFAQSYELCLKQIDRTDLLQYSQLIHKFNKKMTKDQYRVFNCSLEIHEVRSNCGIRFYEVKLTKLHSNHPKQQAKKLSKIQQIELSLFLPAGYQSLQIQAKPNIKTSDNIFIKQQSNRPKQTNIHIKHIKGMLVFLFIMLFGSEILNKLILDYRLSNMSKTITTLSSTVQISIIYNFMMGHYFEKFISDVDDSAHIMELTSQIQLIINQPDFRRIIYDQSINPALTYSRTNTKEGPDEIDLIYFIQSSLQTLSKQQNLKINSSQYQLLMQLQYPSFYQFLETIKQNIYLSCYSQIKLIKSQQITIFAGQMVILSIIMLCGLIKCYKFYGSMLEMMKIHCHFGEKDLQRIRKYYKHVFSIFNHFDSLQKDKYKITSSGSIELQKQLNNQSRDPNLNKRSKDIVNGEHFERYKLRHFFKVIFIFCLLFLIIIGRNISANMLTGSSYQKIEEIKIFFKHIPTHYATAQIIAHSYLPQAVPTFNPTLCQLLLANLRDLIDEPFIGSPKADAFSQKIKQFYYVNACQSGKDSLQRQNISLIDCETVANKSLKNGLREYSRYQEEQLHSILNQGRKASLQDFNEFFRSLQFYHVINIDLVDLAISQSTSSLDEVLSKCYRLTILAISLLTIVALIIKAHVLDFLREEYAFYVFFYENMMPQFIVSQEKMVRSSLVVIDFL